MSRLNFTRLMQPKHRKTAMWTVSGLGIVRWWSHWRRYAFFPNDQTLYDASCLREIAGFCEKQTQLHREALREKSEANDAPR